MMRQNHKVTNPIHSPTSLFNSNVNGCQSNGEKGIAVCEVVCKGRAGHGSLPKGGDNALAKAAEAIQAIQAYWPPTVRVHSFP